MRTESLIHRTARTTMKAVLLASIAAGALAGTAFAGKPGTPAGGGTIAVVLLDSTDGVAHYGQRVTFTVSTTATTQPEVKLECYVGGTRVYYSAAGFYAGYPWPWAQTFTLASGAWTGGAADCTATLYYNTARKTPILATTSFHVAA